MLCLQISINGIIVVTAGHERAESLTARVELLPQDRAVALNTDALASVETFSHELMMWSTPAITLGDEVTIRLVETDAPDQAAITKMGDDCMNEPASAGPICAFCGKGHYEVQTMLSGKGAYICGDCIELVHAEYTQRGQG